MIRKYLIGKLKLAELSELLPHEKVNEAHVTGLVVSIEKQQKFTTPVIIDKKTKLIIDGHHRYNAAIRLGLKIIPVYEVNYLQPRIIVQNGAVQNSYLSKKYVYQKAKEKNLLASKATIHLFESSTKKFISLDQAIPKIKGINLGRLY